jgi:hypothetical protein
LNKRYQFTYINNEKSGLKKVTCGVPRGSVLFLIYLNDIANVLGSSTVMLFADDTNIFISRENLSETNAVANSKRQLMLCNWFTANYLSTLIKLAVWSFVLTSMKAPLLNINDRTIN